MNCFSVAQSCLTSSDPTDCGTPGFPVLYYLLEFVRLVSIELVMPSKHLIPYCPPFPPAFNLSQHQGLLQ